MELFDTFMNNLFSHLTFEAIDCKQAHAVRELSNVNKADNPNLATSNKTEP